MENSLAAGRRLLKGVWELAHSALVGRQLPMLITYLGASMSLVAGSVMQLISMAILARAMGVAQFGLYLSMMALSTFALELIGLGSIEALLRRVARDKSIYPVALGHSLILAALTAMVICPALLILLPFWVHNLSGTDLDTLAIAVFAIGNTLILHLVLLTEKIFIAQGQFFRANLVNLSLAASRLCAAALACLVFSVTSLSSWIEWQVASYIVVLIGCVFAVRGLGMPQWVIMREELSKGFYYCVSSAVMTLKQGIDVIILGLVAGPAVVGAFGLARRIIDTSSLMLVAFFRVVYPMLARAMENGISSGLNLAFKVLTAVVGIAVCTVIGLYIVAPLCPLVFGPQFEVAVPYLYQLAWILIAYAISSTAADALGASGQHGVRAVAYCFTTIGIVVVGLLTYFYSTTGTIIGIYITEFAMAAGFWAAVLYLVRREARAASQSPAQSEPLPPQ